MSKHYGLQSQFCLGWKGVYQGFRDIRIAKEQGFRLKDAPVGAMLKTWGWMMAPWGNMPTPRGAAAIAQGAYCAPTKLKETPVAASKVTHPQTFLYARS